MPPFQQQLRDVLDTVWDDVIIGAGSAGSVMASRLSEQPDRRVLLIEAGPDYATAESLPAPLRSASAALQPDHTWDYQAYLRDSGLLQALMQSVGVFSASPRDMLAAAKAVVRNAQPMSATLQQFPYYLGKVVGGSSAVNGAIALRGLREDFDDWSALGLSDWSWHQVLPYYRKIEADADFGGELHGRSGPVPITRPRPDQLHALQAAFMQGCGEQGLPALDDLNQGSAAGVGLLPTNSVQHERVSAATAYLTPARERPNLRILAGTQVHRVLFEKPGKGDEQGPRACGVELRTADGLVAVRARRVTVCAGTINTVPLLLRSGIGSRKTCQALKVAPVADLPGVGENLIDHPAVMLWMVPRDSTLQGSQMSHQVMARAASEADELPDINLFALSNFETSSAPMLRDLLKSPQACAISVVLTQPASRGRVFLPSAAPDAKPVIELNLGAAADDVKRLMAGVRMAWKIARSAAMQQQVQSVFLWTEAMMASDRLLGAAIGRFLSATWHPVGTARMGAASDPMAVVDARCRVHGVLGLRVVDASVMPLIPRSPTNLTCMMLAERVAEWMQQEAHQETRRAERARAMAAAPIIDSLMAGGSEADEALLEEVLLD